MDVQYAITKNTPEDIAYHTEKLFDTLKENYDNMANSLPAFRFNSLEDTIDEMNRLLTEGYMPQVLLLMAGLLVQDSSDSVLKNCSKYLFTAFPPILAATAATKRLKKLSVSFPEDPYREHTIQKIWQGYVPQRKKTCDENPQRKQIRKALKRRLKAGLNYYRENRLLPKYVDDLWFPTDDSIGIINTTINFRTPLMSVIDLCLATTITNNREISDATWLEAVELAVSGSLKNYIPFCVGREEELPVSFWNQIYAQVIQCGVLIHTLRQFQNQKCYDALYARTINADPKDDEIRELKKENAKQAAAIRILENKNKEQAAEIRQLQKAQADTANRKSDTAKLVHNHNLYIREKDSEIEQLRSYCDALESTLREQEEMSLLEAEEQNKDKPWERIELPSYNVVFVGGHRNMVKKLEELHPQWYFLTDDSRSSLPAECSAIFVWANHLSHKLWWRITEEMNYSKNDLMYCTATNISLLEQQMRFEYWKYKESHHENTP